MQRVPIPWAALAATPGATDFANALAGDGGNDDAKVVRGEQRADAAVIFIVLRMGHGGQRGESQEQQRDKTRRRPVGQAACQRPARSALKGHSIGPR
jgi:hypothetical protein